MIFILSKFHKISLISKENSCSILIFHCKINFENDFSIWSSYLCSKSIFFRSGIFHFENQYGAAISPRDSIFMLQFWKNLKINMEQLFALQMDAFLSGAPQGCELQENLIKHDVLGSLFGTQNGTMWSQGAKKTSPDLMFYKVCAKFATLRFH